MEIISLMALVILLFRMIAFTVVGVFKLIAFIFFAPFFPRRRRDLRYRAPAYARASRSHPRRQEPTRAELSAYQLGLFLARGFHGDPMTSPRAVGLSSSSSSLELSRDQVDCARALQQLGTPKGEAERLAARAVAALGREAKLNELVKYGLQHRGS